MRKVQKIPEHLVKTALHHKILGAGLPLLNVGKVRNTFGIPDYPELLLPVASDRISIFDFVLNALVQLKGEILTALTIFWLEPKNGLLREMPNHLIAWGAGIDAYLPQSLRGNSALQARALVVHKCDIIPVECVVRGYLTGSAWADYRNHNGLVYGEQLPAGLQDGSKLPDDIFPFFTPTTKAHTGHDQPLSAAEVLEKYGGWLLDKSLQIYFIGYKYAINRGIIIADTKFEFGNEWLADEVLTPDSSRFWLVSEWEGALKEKRTPMALDKEVVRQWGKKVETPFSDKSGKKLMGINSLKDTESQEFLEFIHGLSVPPDVLRLTTERYLEIFRLLTGYALPDFQREVMGINP